MGSTLAVKAGTWSPKPSSLSFRWYRNGVAIKGADRSKYKLVASDAGKGITVKVTARRSGFVSTSRTSGTMKVALQRFNVAPVPKVTGTATVGSTLSVSTGTWSPKPSSFAYQWYRNGTAISGAKTATYKLISADAGTDVKVKVTAKRSGYATLARVSSSKHVALQLFTSTPTPVVRGSATVGGTLSASVGKWSPTPSSLSFQWYRNGSAISGAKTAQYTVKEADAGQTLVLRVAAVRAGFATTRRSSAPTSVAAAGDEFTVAPSPTIVGTGEVGHLLKAETGVWTPHASFSYQWYRDGAPIQWQNGSQYTPTGADIGRSLTVETTAEREGFVSTKRRSSPVLVTCGPAAQPGERIRYVRSHVTGNVTWSKGDVDTLRFCPTATEETLRIGSGAVAQVGAGIKIELFTRTIVEGELRVAGTSAAPVSLTSERSSALLESGLSSGQLQAQHLDAPDLNVRWSCGSLQLSRSTLESIVVGYGYLGTPAWREACELSQSIVKVSDTHLLLGDRPGGFPSQWRTSLQVREWAGDIALERNTIAGSIYVFHNRGPDESVWFPPSRSSAVIRDNTIAGGAGLWYTDDCVDTCSIGATPLILQGNTLTNPVGIISVEGTISDTSIVDNTGIASPLYEYRGVTASGHLSLPLAHEGDTVNLITDVFQGSLYVPEGARVDVRPGTTLTLSGIHVGGELTIAGPGTEIGSGRLGSWGLGVTAEGTVAIQGTRFENLSSISTRGDLSILDSVIVEPIGASTDRRSPQRYDDALSVIHQMGGSVYLDSEYVRTPRILKQYSGSAVVQGRFVDPREDVTLIQTCGYDADPACFVDARDLDWGSSDGPFPGWSPDPFTEPDRPLMCGVGTIYPWVGSDETDRGRWLGACDGPRTPIVEITEAKENFENALERFLSECDSDREANHDACAVVTQAYACLTAAMTLAQQSSTFPLALPEDAEVVKKTSGAALESLEALDKPSARLPVAAAGLALKAGEIYSTLHNVGAAYSQCSP